MNAKETIDQIYDEYYQKRKDFFFKEKRIIRRRVLLPLLILAIIPAAVFTYLYFTQPHRMIEGIWLPSNEKRFYGYLLLSVVSDLFLIIGVPGIYGNVILKMVKRLEATIGYKKLVIDTLKQSLSNNIDFNDSDSILEFLKEIHLNDTYYQGEKKYFELLENLDVQIKETRKRFDYSIYTYSLGDKSIQFEYKYLMD